MRRSWSFVWCVALACFVQMLDGAFGAPGGFTPGSVVVSQYGDGVTTSGSVPITLREFTTSGAATGWQVALPTATSGSNRPIVGSISSTGIGFLKQSADSRFLSMIGSGTAASTLTIARVDASGEVNTTTSFSIAGGGGPTPRSAITTNGTDIWWSASAGSDNFAGTRYLTLGGTTTGVAVGNANASGTPNSSGLYPAPLNMRVIGIFNDQLYGSAYTPMAPAGTVPYSFRGVFSIGTGVPKTGPQYGTMLASQSGTNLGIMDSPWDFYVADQSTLYVADDDTAAPASGGLQKWLFSSGSWVKVWTAVPSGATGMRGLTGVVTGSSVQLFGITAMATGTAANDLVALSDTLSGTVAPSFTTLATAPANYVFRGVALAPVPEPSSLAIGVAGAAGIGMILRRRREE